MDDIALISAILSHTTFAQQRGLEGPGATIYSNLTEYNHQSASFGQISIYDQIGIVKDPIGSIYRLKFFIGSHHFISGHGSTLEECIELGHPSAEMHRQITKLFARRDNSEAVLPTKDCESLADHVFHFATQDLDRSGHIRLIGKKDFFEPDT